MAILPGLPGLQVTISSETDDLPEYLYEGEWTQKRFGNLSHEKRMTCYIECLDDIEFHINIKLDRSFKFDTQTITIMVSVDGHFASSKTLEPFKQQSVTRRLSYKVDRISATEVSRKVLRFSSIKKVENVSPDRVEEDARLAAELGEIVVTVYRSEDGEMRTVKTSRRYTPVAVTTPIEIAEKALKGQALSHGVQFGEGIVQTSKGSKHHNDLVDGKENPVGVFVFKYRSRDALKSELVISRSPSPEAEASLSSRGMNSGNAGESREERLARLKKEIENIKSEEQEEGQGKRKREGEGAGRAHKTIRNNDGIMVVDLTDD